MNSIHPDPRGVWKPKPLSALRRPSSLLESANPTAPPGRTTHNPTTNPITRSRPPTLPSLLELSRSVAKCLPASPRSKKKFETDFEPFDPEDNEWDRFPSAGENTTPVAQDVQGLYLLNVFLCISLVEDGDHDPLTKIIQLRGSQELYLAAQHEATQIVASVVTRGYSTRPRRQSTAGSNGKPFLGGNTTKLTLGLWSGFGNTDSPGE